MTRLLAAMVVVMVGCGCVSRKEKSEQYRLGQQHGMNLAMEMCEQAMREQAEYSLVNMQLPRPCPCLDSTITILWTGDSVMCIVIRYSDGGVVELYPAVKP